MYTEVAPVKGPAKDPGDAKSPATTCTPRALYSSAVGDPGFRVTTDTVLGSACFTRWAMVALPT